MRIGQLITGNDDVQQHVASEREKQALIAVSPMARKAIGLEVLPQIEESVFSAKAAENLAADTKRAIEAAFSYKNALYTRLVSYKGIEQSDSQYLTDLMVVMDEWLRSTKSRLQASPSDDDDEKDQAGQQEGGASSTSSKDQEVNVDVNVNVNGQEQEQKDDAEDEEKEDDEEVEEEEDEGNMSSFSHSSQFSNVLKNAGSGELQMRNADDGPEIAVDDLASMFELGDVRL